MTTQVANFFDVNCIFHLSGTHLANVIFYAHIFMLYLPPFLSFIDTVYKIYNMQFQCCVMESIQKMTKLYQKLKCLFMDRNHENDQMKMFWKRQF